MNLSAQHVMLAEFANGLVLSSAVRRRSPGPGSVPVVTVVWSPVRPDREVEIFQLAVLDHHPDACRGGDPGFCSSEEKGGKMRKGGKKVTERTSQQVVEPATQS